MFTINDDNVYQADFITYTYNTDAHYHARLAFYFQMLQEAAGHHAALKGCSIPQLNTEGRTWVVTRTQMDVHRYAPWPEQLFLETWAQPGHKLHFPRGTAVHDAQGEAILTAMSWWAVLDIEHNFRPVRPQEITDRIGSPSSADSRHFFDPALAKRVPYEDVPVIDLYTFKPQISYLDTDFNKHVNNISYIGWMIDSLPVPFLDAYKVAHIDVSWLHQTFRDDDITVYTGATDLRETEKDRPVLYHKIERTEPDGSTTKVWEATTVWAPRSELLRGI
jgi:medium-chain acyl-[acyl-carrier-protein] hydrolase